MIKYAVMTFMYSPWTNSEEGSHEELIKIIGESGADGIEAFANLFMKDDKLVKLYQKEMGNDGLKMPVMDLIANLATPDKKQRHDAYENMRMGIDICDSFNSEIVHVAGCSLPEGVSHEDGRKWVAEGLLEFVDDIERRGMILAIEDFDPSPTLICSADDCLDIIKQTNNSVKFVFDNGNFEAANEHAEDNFKKMIDYTCHFHFKDFSDYPQSTYFGKGVIKNQQIANMIKKTPYSGWVALESYLQDDNGPKETISKELDVLKSMFNKG